MSGAKSVVSIDDGGVLKALQQLRARSQDLRPVFREFGEYLLLSHHDRWSREESPDGRPWAPLSPEYQARKKRNADKILVLDHYLRDTLAYEVDADGMGFGTNRIYGAAHQFGRPEIDLPAREWLGLSDDDMQELLHLVDSHLRNPP